MPEGIPDKMQTEPSTSNEPQRSEQRELQGARKYRNALADALALLATLPSPDETGERAKALCHLGDIYSELGDYPEALNYYLQSLGEYEESGNYSSSGVALHSIGIVYGRIGDYETALEYLSRSRLLFRETGNSLMEVNTIRNIGALHLERGDLDKAVEHELRTLTIYDMIGDKVNAAAALITLGDIHEKKKEPELALSFYVRASETLQETEEQKLFTDALLRVGRVYRETGNAEGARFALEQGMVMVRDIADRQLEYQFHLELSLTFEELGEFRESLYHARRYAVIREEFVNEERNRAVAELQMRFDLERTLKEEELRRQHDVTRAVLETQEGERRRIAGDLHDGVGQTLAATRLNLLRIRDELREEESQAWERSLQLLEKASGDVRTISHTLGSSTLRELGLEAALREMISDMSGANSLVITLQTEILGKDIPEFISLGLFRVAQELISNIVRHAEASEGTLQLMRRENKLILMAEDNGVGFDTNAKRDGMGTRNIETRVKAMRGTVQFDSHPGYGTTITVEVDVKELEEES
ncbi:MAG: sensor histidine kinase [Candidatus Kapaibacterium sp.]